MKQVFNVSAIPLVVDWNRRAVQPGDAIRLDDEIADQLAAGPDWSFENPRQAHERKAHHKAVPAAEPEADPAEDDPGTADGSS